MITDDLRRREAIGRAIIQRREYLPDLYALTQGVACEEALISLEETDAIVEHHKSSKLHPCGETTLFFDDKVSLLEDLQSYIPIGETLYLWLRQSYYCGMLKLTGLEALNMDFGFDAVVNGIIILMYTSGQTTLEVYVGEVERQIRVTHYLLSD